MTLLEAVFAIAVLAVGFAGVTGILTNVSSANRTSAFLNGSLDAFTRFAAEVQNARCDVMPNLTNADPGLQNGVWITAPVGGSGLRTVGLLDAASAAKATAPVRLAYFSQLTAGDCPGPCTRPDLWIIRVQVCDQSNPAAQPCNTPQAGSWVRTFQLTKACTLRPDDAGRGEFGP